jgi:LPXTG-site transpeptidase (sortase) family protein
VLINWLLVWAAFCCGLALALCLAAWQLRGRATRWLVLAALLMVGLEAAFLWQAATVIHAEASALADFGAPVEPEAVPNSTTHGGASPPNPIPPIGTAETHPNVAAHSSNSWPALEAEGDPGRPAARLRIPSLDVDRPIVALGFRNGLWDLKRIGDRVGWLMTTGDRPGGPLAMVLAGHVTLQNYQAGAFGDLERIKQGAEVIYQIAGVDYVYVVREKGRVPPGAVDSLYLEDGRSLILITCTDWDGAARTYAQRLRVRAEWVEQGEADP